MYTCDVFLSGVYLFAWQPIHIDEFMVVILLSDSSFQVVPCGSIYHFTSHYFK